jgi:hypothetical protein
MPHVLVLITLKMHVLMPLLGLLCQLLLCRKMMWHVCCNCADSAGVIAAAMAHLVAIASVPAAVL